MRISPEPRPGHGAPLASASPPPASARERHGRRAGGSPAVVLPPPAANARDPATARQPPLGAIAASVQSCVA